MRKNDCPPSEVANGSGTRTIIQFVKYPDDFDLRIDLYKGVYIKGSVTTENHLR